MPVPVVLAIVAAAVFTVVALVVTIVQLVKRLVVLKGDLDRLVADLGPHLSQLQHDGEVTTAELERVGDQLDELGRQRAGRRRLRPHPPPEPPRH